jgi:hypothetical protein
LIHFSFELAIPNSFWIPRSALLGHGPQLLVRIAFTLGLQNEKVNKRPSSLLEVFRKEETDVVPAKPLSLESSVPLYPHNTDAFCLASSMPNLKFEEFLDISYSGQRVILSAVC